MSRFIFVVGMLICIILCSASEHQELNILVEKIEKLINDSKKYEFPKDNQEFFQFKESANGFCGKFIFFNNVAVSVFSIVFFYKSFSFYRCIR